ncbi:hypothetical protein cypCar_00030476 [Cyprinus carpio]|nr:hypothetical protein cypCar_00030476 [Cyprinus carpio]
MTIINQRFSQYKKLIVSVCVLVLWSVFSKVLKSLMADSTRDELLAFIQQYGSHYISEALYGSELTCNIYFPSKKSQQQLWLQYQKGKTEVDVMQNPCSLPNCQKKEGGHQAVEL